MTANIAERHSQMQCEKYAVDADRLAQRLQQKKEDQPPSADRSGRDTVEIRDRGYSRAGQVLYGTESL